MKYSEISKWAKDQGYTVDREKLAPKTYLYTWEKDGDSGEEHHVFDLAKAIFNHLSDYKHVTYQENYVKPEKEVRYHV